VSSPGELDADQLGVSLPKEAAITSHGVAPPTPRPHAESPRALGVWESVQSLSRPEGVLFQHDLVDDAGTGFPKNPIPNFGRRYVNS